MRFFTFLKKTENMIDFLVYITLNTLVVLLGVGAIYSWWKEMTNLFD